MSWVLVLFLFTNGDNGTLHDSYITPPMDYLHCVAAKDAINRTRVGANITIWADCTPLPSESESSP
jgi:hypothetical protein